MVNKKENPLVINVFLPDRKSFGTIMVELVEFASFELIFWCHKHNEVDFQISKEDYVEWKLTTEFEHQIF